MLSTLVLLLLSACNGKGDDSTGSVGESDTDTDTDSDTDTDDTGPKPWLVPDFALVDMNTSSATYGHTISPRDKKGHVSGWYFIHAD
jgi:hypothetical protein